MPNVDDFLLKSDATNSEIDNKMKDALAASSSDALTWVYDIKSHSMTFTIFDFDGNPINTVTIDNFCKSILDLHLIFPEDEALFSVFCAELDAGKDSITVEFRGICEDYQNVWFRYIGQTILDDDQRPYQVKGRKFDITREKNLLEGQRISQDPLTGLYHREKIRELINEQMESDPDINSAYILIDVDRFSEINKAFGQMQGDTLLQTIAGIIYTNFMTKDLVGRIAGDQFLVYCTNIDEDKVDELVTGLQKRVGEAVVDTNGRPVTLSIGSSFSPKDGTSFDILYTKADLALYEAKQTGGNKYLRFDNESMKDICMGYTLFKMDAFSDDEVRLDKAAKKVNKKLFDYSFDILSKEADIKTALEKVLSEVCLHYDLDRALLSEKGTSGSGIKNTAGWSRKEDTVDRRIVSAIAEKCWSDIEMNSSDEDYIVFEEGRSEKIDLLREIVALKNAPVSSLMFTIFDGGEMVAVMVFEAFTHHDFKENEIATINSVVRLIRSYLLSNQVKHELESESIINKNVMDAQKVIYYIVDEDSYNAKYFSKYAKNLFPHAEYGKKCYETIYGLSAPCENCPILVGKGSDKFVQRYDNVVSKWFNYTATRMKETESKKDMLICVTDVTDFMGKVRGEDTLTVADSFDKFVYSATNLMKAKDREYSLLCAGIKDFAKINDEYGYVIGDEVLKMFADLLKNGLKDGEMVCRIKGDDFAILLQKSDEENARGQLRGYAEVLNGEFKKRFPKLDIVLIAGLYNITPSDEYVNKCVDKALKARNLVTLDNDSFLGFFTYTQELEDRENEEKVMTAMIKAALKEKRFRVYFQPKVDVNDGAIIGAEALVRMLDDNGKLVPPGLFIPLAEKNGLIVDIDNEVYDQTFEYMAKWQREGKRLPLVSVNVSRIQLMDDSLPETIKGLCDKHRISTKNVELEITESVFFQDTERLIYMISRLKDYGFVISMDDFGSGYSTLNFMKKLPVDVIKIDGGFFMRNEMDKKSKAIISAIMQLTQNLEFETVSEGVETEEQVQFIKEQGGRCVQGYYFYKPMPAEEFEKLL